MLVEISHIAHESEERSYSLGDEPLFEPFTGDDIGRLFRECQREYGKCISKIYIDSTSGETKAIGWVFQKKREYEDDKSRTYVHEAWVTLHEKEPEVERTFHYKEIG